MLNITRPKTTKQANELSYYERNKERIKSNVKKYRETHKEEITKKKLIWQKQNRAKRKEYEQNYRDSHKQQQATYDKQYRIDNQDKIQKRYFGYVSSLKGRFTHWRINAGKRGKEWGLEFSDVENMPLVCHYTGVELTLEPNKNNTISLDRIDSSKGYVKGNVCFCLATINSMKYTLSQEDFYTICKMVVQHREKGNSA